MDLTMSEEQKLVTQTVRRFGREQVRPVERGLDPDPTAPPSEATARPLPPGLGEGVRVRGQNNESPFRWLA